ncbi:hypothetical protein GCM10027203_73530 [Nonomuraea fastidiosa]
MAGGATFSVATCRIAEPPAQAAARIAPRARLTDIPGCLSWAVTPPAGGPRRPSPASCTGRPPVRSSPGIRRRRDRRRRRRARHVRWPHRLGPPRGALDGPVVTLLGDAVHTMSPGRGDGANVGLRRTALLSALLSARPGAR